MNSDSILGLRTAGARIRLVASCLAALLLAAAWSAPVLAQEAGQAPRAIPNERCLGCHDDDELKADDGRSMAVHEAEFAASKHRRLDCTTCHSDALTVRHPREDLGPVPLANCQDCHADEITALESSVHFVRAEMGKDASGCGKCHGNVHTLPRRPGLEAPLSPVNRCALAANATRT